MTRRICQLVVLAVLATGHPATAQARAAAAAAEGSGGYVIGPDDVLSIVFWRDKDMSADVVVRPDGRISLPLINDIQAGGLTPGQLGEVVNAAARRFVEEPSATVVVKQINSRKLFITGQVEKPGPYPMTGRTTVLQLISMAGGLREFAEGKRILIMRTDKNGKQFGYGFNYREVIAGKNLAQNIELQPGDTVVVP